MGATIDTGRKGSFNVELNIVPFIDLMSCLTAFLLVTAVWSNTARIDVAPSGLGRDGWGHDDQVEASVHITEDAIWVGVSRINEFQRIPRAGDEHDWETLRQVLVAHKHKSYFEGRRDIEVGADDRVSYQTLISTIDTAMAAGFDQVGVMDPASLSARRQL